MTTRRRGETAAWLLAMAAGLTVDLVVLGARDLLAWLPDVAVGWSFLGAAVVLGSRVPGRRVGTLLGLTGVAWFLGTLHPALVHLHRGVLLHAVLGYPAGRLTGLGRWTVAAAYATAVAPGAWTGGGRTVALSAVLGLAVGWHVVTARGTDRRARSYAAAVAAAFLGTSAAAAGVRGLFPQGDADAALVLAYSTVLVGVPVALARGLLQARWERVPVADLVVQLDDDSSAAVHRALARALGDPSLQVGYRRGDRFVDAGGRPVDVPAGDTRRAVTTVRRAGRDLAVLVHDSSLLTDPALAEALATVGRLVGENARLQDAVSRQVAELEESRRRVVVAADRQRAALEAELRRGALLRLQRMGERLAAARRRAAAPTADQIDDAVAELSRTRDELAELAQGLHPRQLERDGLVPALRSLAARSPVPVEVVAGPDVPVDVPLDTAVTAWFVCSEAVTNAVKHAHAGRVDVRIDGAAAPSEGRLRVTVADEGVGGADRAAGSGLLGLADRVEAVGGTLVVDGPVGGGTRVAVELPLVG